MTKIWSGIFWGAPTEEPPFASARGDGPLRAPRLMNASAAALVALTVGIAVFAQPVWELSERAATELLDPSRTYVEAVLAP
jgi:multicomponent Na+:H+ antiporter subunit D